MSQVTGGIGFIMCLPFKVENAALFGRGQAKGRKEGGLEKTYIGSCQPGGKEEWGKFRRWKLLGWK